MVVVFLSNHCKMNALTVLLLVSLPLYVLSAPVMSIQNNRLLIDGTEFIVKGVNYSPSPIGQKGMSNGYGGTGFCSAKITPWNEWKSACYDSDYYDGSPDPYTPTRFPTGFKPLWERDFPYIKSIGANTIRLYNANPTTLAATKQYTNLFNVSSGKDHTQFVKYCEDNGLKVIFPLFSDEPSFLNLDEDVFRRYVRWQIDEVGNSPAILMWQLGNEQSWSWYGRSNNWNNTAYTNKLNRMLTFIRTYTKSKWNRFIPVTSTIPNTFKTYNYMFKNWAVDIFTANIFTTNYDSLFGGNSDQLGIAKLSCYYNKPFIMTEIGPTAAAGKVYNAGTINTLWYQFVKNIPTGGVIGAVWFEQTDEPALGKDFGLFGLTVTTRSDGSRSDQQDVFIPDTLVRKQQYTDALQGTYNNQQYNFKANIFNTLLGRNPYTTSNNPDTCASRYTLKACPGSGYPKCSGNGICDRTLGRCTCQAGWSGSTCSTASCSCNSRGVCNTQTYPIQCACNAGYWGPNCQYSVQAGVCPKLNNVQCTNGNGICVNGECKCHPGWVGTDCSVTDVGIGSINVQQYFVGCLSTATFPVAAPTASTLTNQECRYYCALRGYTYAATTGGNTCQCGASLTSTATSTSCTANCNGDSQQKCGGTSSQKSTYLAGTAAATGYVGCFIDSATRDLPVSAPNGAGTVDTCRKECAAQGYTYSGSQNGAECWCGNSYGNSGGKVSDSECSASCSGDSSVKCGAGYRNSVYTTALPVGYQFYG